MENIVRVKLQDIVDAISMQFDDQQQFINLETGEVMLVQDEHFRMAEDIENLEHFEHPIEWEKEAILEAYDVLASEDKYLKLPGKYEVNDYEIMEAFCLQLPPSKSQAFLSAIRGRGAFRRFRHMLEDSLLLEQWYRFEQEALREIALAWCSENKVQYE